MKHTKQLLSVATNLLALNACTNCEKEQDKLISWAVETAKKLIEEVNKQSSKKTHHNVDGLVKKWSSVLNDIESETKPNNIKPLEPVVRLY
jgi:hypothetical protein